MTQANNVAIESSQINSSGVLQPAGGGTGLATVTGILKGNGTSPMSVATAGTDYLTPSGALGTPSSGALTNCTSVPVNQATGTLPVANGGSGQTTYTNGQLLIGNTTGNTLTKANLTQGSGISITNGAGSITIAATGGGTVTSVATGNGLSGGTITSSGTLVIACPTWNTVGSYAGVILRADDGSTFTAGSNYAAGSGNLQMVAGCGINGGSYNSSGTQISGTWKWMSYGRLNDSGNQFLLTSIACRVS